ALRLIRSHSPVGRLISRHTRDLLRRYHKAGKLETPIAERSVEDRFVEMSAAESRIYAAVEDYISSTYNQASAKRRNAVGFVMTVYRRRLASSFLALRCTLEDRLEAMTNSNLTGSRQTEEEVEDINLDTEGDVLSPDEIAEFEQASLAEEEKSEIARLLDDIRQLPPTRRRISFVSNSRRSGRPDTRR
ncbi:MAG: helicase, partial [Verrucomicrobiae bacterium]|nr:helicase [Verrucomicrobiae bacterium]